MTYRPHQREAEDRRRGFVLLAVLIVLVVLSLAAYQFSEMMLAEYKAADSSRRTAQARALADSGIQYAAALLSSPDATTTTLDGNPWNNPQLFQGILVNDSDQPRFRGRFSLVALASPDDIMQGQSYYFGVNDESSKINLNALMKLDPTGQQAFNILMNLPNMTEDVANSIVDWMDPDSEPRSDGAEDDYYTTLPQPYHCKNGPLDSLEELLLVKGVTPQLLFGNDLNRNGILDPEEDDGSGQVDLGWSAYLTVLSREQNVDSQGMPRINVNESDLNDLLTNLTTAVGGDLANYIVAYRMYGPSSGAVTSGPGSGRGGRGGAGGSGGRGGAAGRGGASSPGVGASGAGAAGTSSPTITMARGQVQRSNIMPNGGGGRGAGGRGAGGRGGGGGGGGGGAGGGSRRIASLYELINSSVDIPDPNNPNQKTRYNSPLKDSGQQQQLLPTLLDQCTTTSQAQIPARVNVLTAPQAVLMSLPGMDANTLQAIIANRPSPMDGGSADPSFQTTAWLVTQANVSPKTLQTLDKYITSRTQVYRVQSVGYFDGGGPMVRLEAVIDTNLGRPRILSYRDMTLMGRAYDFSSQQ
jgi:DNA uptake protein ComE-like DNA-binding protein/type II secretory pathway pseudopilin PulG